jgi:hypothetical protein
MTTGSRVSDSRYSLVYKDPYDCFGATYDNTVRNLGSYLSKSWSGGDAVKSPKRPFTLDRFSYRVFRKDGSSYIRTSVVKRFPQGVRPPRGEHGYTSTLVKTTDSVYEEIRAGSLCPNGRSLRFHGSTSQFTMADMLPLLWSANEDISLIGKLSDRISGEGFNMAIFLGEGRESLGTIAEASRRIAKALKELRKGRVAAAAESLLSGKTRRKGRGVGRELVTQEWLANNWLQLQYGWRPLLQDIYGAAQHFAAMQNRPQSLTYRASRSKTLPTRSSSPSYPVLEGLSSYGKTIKAVITRIDETSLLGLKDPASLAWELLPWSFVADWIIPIGNYLQAINLERSLSGVYVISSKYSRQSFRVGWTGDTRISYTGLDFAHTTIMTSREVSTSLPIPKPEVKPWAKVLSWQHAVNSIALLVGVFSGSRVR